MNLEWVHWYPKFYFGSYTLFLFKLQIIPIRIYATSVTYPHLLLAITGGHDFYEYPLLFSLGMVRSWINVNLSVIATMLKPIGLDPSLIMVNWVLIEKPYCLVYESRIKGSIGNYLVLPDVKKEVSYDFNSF